MPPVGASQATAEHSHPSSHVNRISDQDQAELERLNRAVTRMQKHTLADPYIITIAQDKHLKYQYQWRSQQYQWLHGTPFRYDEGEGIQYQTFNFQEPGSSMLSLHAQHYPDERPGTADSTRNATGSNTPAQGPKKVISFGAYKSKKTGETPARDGPGARDTDKSGKQPAVKGPAERVKALEAESADMIKAAEENERSEAGRDASDRKDAQRRKEPLSEQFELKRKREENTATRKDKVLEINGKHSPPPPKKPRTEAPTSAPKETNRLRSPSPARRTTNKPDARTDTYMPPKLSPLRYEPEVLDIFELPPRLSPELPANIDAALKATKTKHAIRPERDERVEGRRPVGSKALAISRNKSPEDRDRTRARSRSPEASIEVQSASADTPAEPSTTSAEKRIPSLITRIKFRKARKEDVQRILKLPARPDKNLTASHSTLESSDDEDAAEHDRREATSKVGDKTDEVRRSGKGVAQKIAPLSKKADEKRATAEKRPRRESTTENVDDTEPLVKRKRVNDDVPDQLVKKKQAESGSSQQPPSKKNPPAALDLKKAPSTPVPPPAPSPAVPTKQKSHMVTPVTRKDLLHPRREVSTDSQVETPPAPSSTPSEQKRSSQPNGTTAKPPSSIPPAKVATSQAWDAEQKRLERLGRELKHGASDLLSNKPNSRARRTAAAKSLESLFCYLLAFTCSDRDALVANQNVPIRGWRSLPPFCSFVGRTTQEFPALNGLAPSLTVVIHARILEIAAQFPNEGPSRDSLLELSGALHKAALHADEHLDIDTVITAFPKTWAARSKTSLPTPSQSEFGEPKKLLQGAYRLPLGVQTDPLQAARAGVALLKEWIAKEGLDYDFKLGV